MRNSLLHTSSMASGHLPTHPFFASRDQRVALARERYFEHGERPTGLVSEAVLQSWTRCLGARRNPGYTIAFDAVSRSRIHATLERNRELIQAAGEQISQLESALSGSACRVLLTDANGVIVHATQSPGCDDEPLLKVAARVGVSLSENVVGTNAPGLVVKTCAAALVLAGEHFFHNATRLRCAAAPIHDGRGRLAGVLDLTTEAVPFAFDAGALVGHYATLIENRLLLARARGDLVLQFQVGVGPPNPALQALAGVNTSGHMSWCNAAAQQLVGLRDGEWALSEPVLGLSPSQLLAYAGSEAQPLRLPNGLTVWLRVQAPSPAAGAAHAAPEPMDAAPTVAHAHAKIAAAPSTLDKATRALIENTLAECGGNLSLAARRLKVSRGLLYRRLRQLRAAAPQADPQ